ncbi:MAG: 50S ribosomal protein L10 [Candidatus Izemoplasmatales bacterium]|jgi:large subunit ribosomal protein L10|nr:50S ribosomal protein L10 [bacterium]MDZ4196975.1 50S ribosomal protein L10 [Candidatus Izemoplasmatales bacterium]
MSNTQIIAAKQEEVQVIQAKMQQAKAVLIAEYRGLTVQKTEELRRLLRKEGCELLVAKNNLVARAANNLGYTSLEAELVGPNGIVFAMKESVSAAKVLIDFTRKNPKLLVKAGYVDGDFYNKDEIRQIAGMPSRQVLLTMLASTLLAPLQQLAIGLDLIANKENN